MPQASVGEPLAVVVKEKLATLVGREKRTITRYVIGCNGVNNPWTKGR